jgi:hypothetical protein
MLFLLKVSEVRKSESVSENDRPACAQHHHSYIRHSIKIFRLTFNDLPTSFRDAKRNFSNWKRTRGLLRLIFRNAQCRFRDLKNAESDRSQVILNA